jgi:asparagine synthase (glutamine-hydrolysing)
MFYSLEGRDPLMDHRIFELAGTYPDQWKIGSLGGKHMLKDIVHTLVPRELVDRPKQGFSPPMAKWLRGELRPLVERTTRQEWLREQGVFDPVLVSRMGDAFLTGKMNNARQMWIIVAFQLWYDHWINGGAAS